MQHANDNIPQEQRDIIDIGHIFKRWDEITGFDPIKERLMSSWGRVFPQDIGGNHA